MSDSDTSAQRASSAVLRYGLAVSSIAAALIVTLLLHPDRLLSPVFFLAIMLSAWIGGIGAGLVAALLATMALAYFFLPPIYSLRFDPVHAPQLLVFFYRPCSSARGAPRGDARRTCSSRRVMSWKQSPGADRRPQAE